MSNEILNLFKNKDIVIIGETHLGVRSKCPDGFILTCRSKVLKSKRPRGGVAVYRNINKDIQIDVITDDFRDSVIFNVRHTELFIAAVYIPPNTSEFYDDISFSNIELMLDHYKSSQLIIVGDMNTRIGNLGGKYSVNPDHIVNEHGKKLLKIYNDDEDVKIVNGYENFDSKFTFYRGKVRSQVDYAVTNSIQGINSFSILQKTIYSDHCPLEITCMTATVPDLHFIKRCSEGLFSYDHCDVNKRICNPISLMKLDIPKVVESLNELGTHLLSEDLNIIDVDILCAHINDGIYKSCQNNRNPPIDTNPVPPNFQNCNSTHFKAMANINLFSYNHYKNLDDSSASDVYLRDWIRFTNLAKSAEHDELNLSCNKLWKNIRSNSKKMWSKVDWKGKCEVEKKTEQVNESTINDYFKKIFQSEKTKNTPTVNDIIDKIESYDTGVWELDKPPEMGELELACKTKRNGVSFDGLSSDILLILPESLKQAILVLIRKIFFGDYPEEWKIQILHAITKHGHTYYQPQLRGIAVAPLLGRVYDTIMDNRFRSWFQPNPEQSGFRSEQGCPLPLFTLIIFIVYCKEKGLDLFVGFLDFEKAFDYVNRAKLLTDLMNKGCGSKYVQALSKMYIESFYAPKVGDRRLGESIRTVHGVTQGRRSSTNYFSFFVSDMPLCTRNIGTNDFLDPFNLAQLADDTITLAESFNSLQVKLKALFEYSRSKGQVPNIKKTLYGNFVKNPVTEPMKIEEGSYVNSIHLEKGCNYLGMLFLPTDELIKIIRFNIKSRKKHIAKYHAWLEVNETTPIETKLLVLDSCVLGAMLYGCETWGDLSEFADELVVIEHGLVKRALSIKSTACNDTVYFELQRPSVIATIKDRQYAFFQKVLNLSTEDALIGNVISLCKDCSIISYYYDLKGNNCILDLERLNRKIHTVNTPLVEYYKNLVGTEKSCIYNCYINDYYRIIITRWRLSCHRLKVETGRHIRPRVPREQRVCGTCNIIEDEQHVVFVCPLYQTIRTEHEDLLGKNTTITMFLNPDRDSIISTARMLYRIEKLRIDLKLQE